jgi:hypothetical protein
MPGPCPDEKLTACVKLVRAPLTSLMNSYTRALNGVPDHMSCRRYTCVPHHLEHFNGGPKTLIEPGILSIVVFSTREICAVLRAPRLQSILYIIGVAVKVRDKLPN